MNQILTGLRISALLWSARPLNIAEIHSPTQTLPVRSSSPIAYDL